MITSVGVTITRKMNQQTPSPVSISSMRTLQKPYTSPSLTERRLLFHF